MRTKQQILDRLHNDPLFAAALNSVDEEEAKKIESTLTPLLVEFATQMDQFIDAIANNPEAIEELRRGLTSVKPLVNNEPTITSGSIG